jgi:hypothetical protein
MGAGGKARRVPLALLSALTLSLAGPPDAPARGNCDQVLPGCGICYPGGYDVNTVGEVHGVVLAFQAPAEGPVRIVVASERERWTVLACPTRFLKTAKLLLATGDPVTVRGSKSLGADGSLYLVAREIWPPRPAPVVILRDRDGMPFWSGGHPGREAGRLWDGF